MGFNANSSEKPVFQESKLYTGLTNVRIIAINPNKQQLEDMGYKPQADPVYITTDNAVKKLRLDFYVAHKTLSFRTKITFFLENKIRADKTGNKVEYINDFGRTAWGTPDSVPTGLKWFDSSTARAAKVGEADLHMFLMNWLNISPNDEAKLDKFDALFSEDYSELRGLLHAFAENEVRVLLTVRDGKYQSIYSRYFDRATNKRTNYWESHIKGQIDSGYPPKEDFQNSFVLKEWIEPNLITDPPEGGAASNADPF